jgi:hypothetical protein
MMARIREAESDQLVGELKQKIAQIEIQVCFLFVSLSLCYLICYLKLHAFCCDFITQPVSE